MKRRDLNLELQKEEEGATMVEYALLIALIAIVAILALQLLGTSVSEQFSTLGNVVGNSAEGARSVLGAA